MTTTLDKYLKIQKEQSEIRQRLGVISLMKDGERTAEVEAEALKLRQRQPVVETELQASYAEQRAEQEKGTTIIDAEARELQRLTKTANVGEVISATVEQRMTTGATAEIQAHFKINSNQIPIEMLRLDRGVEERAAAVPANIGGAVQAEVITPILSTGDGAFLGIERPTVPVGDAAYPVLGTVPSVKGPFTGSDDAAGTDATFVANTLSPERLQASYAYRASDAARFSGLDPSLRLALNGGLTEALDKQAISGTDGLLTSTNLANHNVTAESTFALYLKGLLFARVDGRYARSPSDVRILVGSGTFTHANEVYKAAETDETAAERLAARSGGLMVSPHVPAVASNRQNALIRLGMERGGAVQPMWEGITILSDPYSRSTQGELVITAVLLANFKITRAAQWDKRQTQHA